MQELREAAAKFASMMSVTGHKNADDAHLMEILQIFPTAKFCTRIQH